MCEVTARVRSDRTMATARRPDVTRAQVEATHLKSEPGNGGNEQRSTDASCQPHANPSPSLCESRD